METLVATLVPEEDVWQFVHHRNPDAGQRAGIIAVVDYEDPSATEAIEAHDARTGEKLDSEEVRKGRTKDVRSLMNSKSKFEVKMEVDESDLIDTDLIKMG